MGRNRQKIISIVASFFLVLQTWLPYLAFVVPTYAQTAPQDLKSEIEFNTDKNEFKVSVNTKEEVEYVLSYQTDKQTEAISGKAEKNDSNFERTFYTGTCSTEGNCLPHNVLRGVLKTKIQSLDYLNSKSFKIENGQLSIVLNESTDSLELNDDEKKWLTDGGDLSPPPTPTEEPTPTPEGEILDGIFTDEPSEIIEPEQSVLPDTEQNETLTINIIDDIDSSLLLFNEDTLIFDSSATLSTDKEDYAPTELVIITGSGFNAEETYTLVITSEDEPTVRFEVQVLADLDGEFIYLYQLDGIYRPNYKVELKDSVGEILASTTFTDAPLSDTTEPETTYTDMPNDFTNDNTLDYAGTSTDDMTGVVKVEYRITDNSTGEDVVGWNPADGDFDNELSEDFTFTTTELADGEYIVETRATDGAGNIESTATHEVTIDTIAPTVQSMETMDSDGDGYLDGIQLKFSEDINDSMLDEGSPDGWDVADPIAGEEISTEDDDDNILVLSFGEGTTPDTANRPNVTYTPTDEPTSTHDLAGNELESYSGVPDDGASPVIITAETQDTNANGQIDAIELTFSEDINDELLIIGSADGWDVNGYNNESIGTGTTGSDNVLLLTFDESGILDTGETPDISYTEGSGGGSTHDSAGNELTAVVLFTSIDGAAPLVPEASPPGSNYDNDQLVSLTSSDESGPVPDIYYTLDGSEPNSEDSTLYADPILIDKDTTLKAVAYDSAGNASGVLTEEYGIAPVISSESSSSVTSTTTTITWVTDDLSTSRVIYDTVSHASAVSGGDLPFDKYGYASTTDEFDTSPKVTSHSVGLTGLTAGTTYYYRTISRGSPEAVSDESSFTTSASTTSTGTVAGTSTGGVSTPTCSDTPPGSAPSGLSAVGGLNSVTLKWNKASDPVSYYLVTYGLSSGSQAFGNPNIGDASTTSYTVSNLSGGITYYFKVRAGNGCAPGEFSNEATVTPSGGFVEGPAAGFAPGVLGVATEEANIKREENGEQEILGAKTQEQKTQNATKIWLSILFLLLILIYIKNNR